MQFYYRSTAERALNIPATLFVQKRLDEVAMFWKKKPVEGVRRLFLVDFTRDPYGNYLVFDADRAELYAFPASDEALAIIVACTPWQVLSYRHGVAQSPAVRVDERNPEFRLILNPITDDASHVDGVAGVWTAASRAICSASASGSCRSRSSRLRRDSPSTSGIT